MSKILLSSIFLLFFLFFLPRIFFRKKVNQPNEKILKVSLNGRPTSLDPIRCNDGYGYMAISKIYERLFEYAYLQRPYKLKPNLLAEMPKVSSNFLEYTFKLKKNIFFHDNRCFKGGKGREVYARDVIYSLLRMADINNKGLSYTFLRDKIRGLDRWRAKYRTKKANYDEDIEGFEIIDDYTFKIKLKKIYPQFLMVLAQPEFSIVAREACEMYGEDFGFNPVGTGPFVIKGNYNNQSNKIIYLKNPQFRKKYFPTKGEKKYNEMIKLYGNKQIPFVNKIIYYIIIKTSPRLLKLKKGHLDLLDITNDGIIDNVLDGENNLKNSFKNQDLVLSRTASNRVTFILFNYDHKIFHNKKLRQAMTIAYDRLEYNRLFNKNTNKIAQSIITPGLMGYTSNFKNPLYLSNGHSINLKKKLIEKAKQLLVEAGYPKGEGIPEIIIDTLSIASAKNEAIHFKNCMNKIGIKVKIITNTWAKLITKANSKSFMALNLGWSTELPDGYKFLQIFYGPESYGGINYCNFNDPEYNRQFKMITKENDIIKRKLLQENLNKKLSELVPCIFINYVTNFVLLNRRIQNYEFNPYEYCIEQYLDIKN